MKINTANWKRRILRKVYGALSLTSALFVFQACYGTPHDMERDVYIQGIVKSKATSLPIPGIKVSIENLSSAGITDSAGRFEFYTFLTSQYKITIQDIDSSANGSYKDKDTSLTRAALNNLLNISLDVK